MCRFGSTFYFSTLVINNLLMLFRHFKLNISSVGTMLLTQNVGGVWVKLAGALYLLKGWQSSQNVNKFTAGCHFVDQNPLNKITTGSKSPTLWGPVCWYPAITQYKHFPSFAGYFCCVNKALLWKSTTFEIVDSRGEIPRPHVGLWSLVWHERLITDTPCREELWTLRCYSEPFRCDFHETGKAF